MISVYIFTVALLTLAWCILSGSFSLSTMLIGLAAGTGCAIFARVYLPLDKTRGISLLRLAAYPFYMLIQIYIAAFSGIKMVLTDARAGIVKIKPILTNDFLRILLAHSATLTPGTIALDIKSGLSGRPGGLSDSPGGPDCPEDDSITFLCLIGKNSTPGAAEQAIRKMEKQLLKAEKRRD